MTMARDWNELGATTYEGWCLDRIATALEVMALGPQAQPAAETPLPDDFPALGKLIAAGIRTAEGLPKNPRTLEMLGLTPLEANRVLSYARTVL